MSEFKALIVDFGGVLTTPLQDAMAGYAESLGIELQDLVRVALRAYAGEDDNLVTGFETGRVPEDEFAVAFAERLSEVTPKPVDPGTVVDGLFAGMSLEDDMFEAVAAARAHGLRTGLLSNSWSLRHYPRKLMDGAFDSLVISGEVGLRKPEPAIYRLAVERLGVTAKECVFVDDHPGHLKAALDEGMTTVLHRTPVQTRAELRELLGIPL
ncbi:MAG TPA: HAD family phosphatase [Actinomycetota bacterium]